MVILDEFGYICADKDGAKFLFTHISLRSGQKSTIITTNLSFNRWGEIFGDSIVKVAKTDRLSYTPYVVNMNGNLYLQHRMKESKALINRLEN